jgi:tocopherol O-methyltransferase
MRTTNKEAIIEYYNTTEASYIDGWDLNNSYSIHYGYKDATTKSFRSTLLKMNEVLADIASIKETDFVLDAGCGIGGSMFYLAQTRGCKCIGLTLSQKQVEKGNHLAVEKGLEKMVRLEQRSYLDTGFPDNTFDVVWGLESICYAESKEDFVKEAYRILKPGGRLIIADGMVTKFENNAHPTIKKWLTGWCVNFLESPERFNVYFQQAGFREIRFRDITKHTNASSARLFLLFFANKMWALWKRVTFRYKWNKIQEGNVNACYHQYVGMRRKLWIYGIIVGTKQSL